MGRVLSAKKRDGMGQDGVGMSKNCHHDQLHCLYGPQSSASSLSTWVFLNYPLYLPLQSFQDGYFEFWLGTLWWTKILVKKSRPIPCPFGPGLPHHLTRFLELIEINDYQFGKTKIHFDKYINLNIIRAGGPVY